MGDEKEEEEELQEVEREEPVVKSGTRSWGVVHCHEALEGAGKR